MQSKHALIVAGILTLTLAGGALATGIVDAAPAARQPTPVSTVPVPTLAPAVVPTTAADPAAARKTAATLDSQARPEIARLQQQVDDLEASVRTRMQNVETLRQQAADLQTGITADAQVYNDAVAELQTAEAQVRQQLDATVAALEAAYAELSAQQGPQGSAPVQVQPVSNPSDDGGEQEHQEHEHEDHGHEDHGGGDDD